MNRQLPHMLHIHACTHTHTQTHAHLALYEQYTNL